MATLDPILLEEVLTHIHNRFVRSKATGKVEISGGTLPDDLSEEIPEGAWYWVEGSLLNDGVHLHPDEDLSDEEFMGTVSILSIPRPLLRIVEEIQDWIAANSDARLKALSSPYASESFGGYSYSLRGDIVGENASGGLSGWQAAFASRLNAWRKIG